MNKYYKNIFIDGYIFRNIKICIQDILKVLVRNDISLLWVSYRDKIQLYKKVCVEDEIFSRYFYDLC